MKSIKPGRGPSGMSFVGSVIAIIFGVFWTIMATSITANSPFPVVGIIFPLFGVLFIILGVFQAIYNYKNATGKDRYSIFDITDSKEESDPSDERIKNKVRKEIQEIQGEHHNDMVKFCPYCGIKLESDYIFCPKCGKTAKE